MKQKVELSTYSIMVSAICLIILISCQYYYRNDWGVYVISAALIIGLILALFYMPLSISVDGSDLHINRSLRIKSIPIKEIESVRMVSPTMAERKICGSGGFFGYWGWLSEPSIGKYFAYYGKASDCFLIELKNGKKYMLGCKNASKIVELIKGKIQ